MGTEEKTNSLVGITASESELNSLFKEVLDGVRDDIAETQVNVEMYFDALSENGGKEMYGINYNEALKIKGLARKRQLDFLNMFKDRVSKKEQLKAATEANLKKETGGAMFSHAELNNLIEESENKKLGVETDDDFEDEDFEENY